MRLSETDIAKSLAAGLDLYEKSAKFAPGPDGKPDPSTMLVRVDAWDSLTYGTAYNFQNRLLVVYGEGAVYSLCRPENVFTTAKEAWASALDFEFWRTAAKLDGGTLKRLLVAGYRQGALLELDSDEDRKAVEKALAGFADDAAIYADDMAEKLLEDRQ